MTDRRWPLAAAASPHRRVTLPARRRAAVGTRALIGAVVAVALAASGCENPTALSPESVPDLAPTFAVADITVGSETKLTAGDAAAGDHLGWSVSIDGDKAIVGAPHHDDGGDASGSAYVFRWTGTGWSQEAMLVAGDMTASSFFGAAVSISGELAIVGAPYGESSGSRTGAAYVFRQTGTGWVQEAKLTASDAAAGDQFGVSVSLSGDLALIGANTNSDAGPSSGSAYVFRRTGTSWVQEAKLTASDAAFADSFGQEVSLDGTVAVLGAPGNDDAGSSSGSAYVFRRAGTTWSEEAKLTASDAAEGDGFGAAVSVNGDLIVVGAAGDDDGGSAYVFHLTGETWSEEAKLTASDAAAGDAFGVAVSVAGNLIVVGAVGDDIGGRWDAGSAYVFGRVGTGWSEAVKLTASDAASSARFGYSVAVNDGPVIVGAIYDQGDVGFGTGAAYVYELAGGGNTAPTADAGPDQTVECAGSGGTDVTLDGSASDDADGDALTYTWTDAAGTVLSTDVGPTVSLGLGTHVLTLTVSDGQASASDDVTITVEDTTAPELTVIVVPPSLWPPNHKYVEIGLVAQVRDVCDPAPAVTAVVVSSEPDDANGNGDGRTTGDIRVTTAGGAVLLSSNASPQVAFDPLTDRLELRAERAGGGAGRIYTVTVTAADASGNARTQTLTVTVPHDRS